MRIVKDHPPVEWYLEIFEKFKLSSRKNLLFAWGDIIYNPDGFTIPQELIAHETVHGVRQGSDVLGWWRRYIDDPVFRLEEEKIAHKIEYLTYCADRTCGRNSRRVYLTACAKRLSSSLYGNLISFETARVYLKAKPETKAEGVWS